MDSQVTLKKTAQNFLKVLLVINSHKIKKFKYEPKLTLGDPTPGNTAISSNEATSLYDAFYGGWRGGIQYAQDYTDRWVDRKLVDKS
jgi:hypothetical protein